MKEIMKEMVGGCCVCSDERGWPDNPLVYCDGNGCTVAVHQACYGIIAVPTGPWYCRKCESPETKGKVRCELCPSKSGALKRTDTGGWAHVVCALYIPEVRFGNVTSMEPIVLRLIPPERYNKTCYICQDLGKTHRSNAGACMQCNKSGCKQQFHVTCAQSLGLLCEEAGNYLDNVKYCGYCQHHYSKLPGRKSSHSSGGASGKNTPNSVKTPTNAPLPMDKKKQSPSRRGSSTGDGGGGSKNSTPAPSPQHSSESHSQNKGSGGSTPRENTTKIPLPSASPGAKQPETGGVISSIASINASVASIPMPPTPVTSTVVHAPISKPSMYQESVITNTDAMDTKQTKKRKAVTATNMSMTPVDYASTTPPAVLSDINPQNASNAWEASNHGSSDANMEGVEKIIKKAKTDGTEPVPVMAHFSSVSPAPPPPPPPPAHSPRHLPSPMPGPSGLNQITNIRSPSQPQGCGKEREGPASLLVSVPLPSTSHGLNLTAHAHAQVHMHQPQDMAVGPAHIFHQLHKQAAMEPTVSGHSPHGVSGRGSWGGLNVAYEMQDPNKPGVSGMAGCSKDASVGVNLGQMPPVGIRNKKRAAMATSVVSMANSVSTMQTATAQNLASVRRPPQPTPPPIYQEIIKDSPPSSPSSERPLKPKLENKLGASCTAPHMLGNELNPESGAAQRLQEQLSAELAAHAVGSNAPGGPDMLVPPPLINKATPSTSTSGIRGTTSAQSLDQLLERQWEQGSQFLMEQAQHFDIASLLSCLHQLRTENVRLEEHVGNLLQRRDHLLAVNARLAIPLTAVVPGPGESSRCPRENGAPVRAPPGTVRPNETITSDRPHQLIMREVQQKPS
ncbi:protein AF-10 isoform X8 [Nymphalis io]|uniref:protein AF-10 isoform X8 n=1 Tax=Inachis io TaxID=171585 RepID=UPI00216A5182|nr:protein AF-10 isoform X8 [Nymphalis io]